MNFTIRETFKETRQSILGSDSNADVIYALSPIYKWLFNKPYDEVFGAAQLTKHVKASKDKFMHCVMNIKFKK